jgi:hypothetical protein
MRKDLLIGASILVGTLGGLLTAEVLTRVFADIPSQDRVELRNPGTKIGADCYSAEKGSRLPLDLRKPEDAATFAKALPFIQLLFPIPVESDPEIEPLNKGMSAPSAIAFLSKIAPLCVIYDVQGLSRRFLVAPPGYRETIAVIGDSFAYGQGVAEEETFVSRLAQLRSARVRSYAIPGANLPEIQGEFENALTDHAEFRFSKLIYVFVPNDPYLTDELRLRERRIDDLMNLRWRAVRLLGDWRYRALRQAGQLSALARLLLFRMILHEVRADSIQWYRDILDPNVNSGLELTVDRLAEFARQAKAKGIEFVVALYPLMVDFDPYPFEKGTTLLRQLVEKKGIKVIDLLPAFRSEHGGRRLVVHGVDAHPNGLAQEIAVKAVDRALGPTARAAPR